MGRGACARAGINEKYLAASVYNCFARYTELQVHTGVSSLEEAALLVQALKTRVRAQDGGSQVLSAASGLGKARVPKIVFLFNPTNLAAYSAARSSD